MTIGELARRHGVRPSAIRYYESIGVLRPPARVRGRREYGADAGNVLRLVQSLKRAGFTLPQIRALVRAPEGSAQLWRSAAQDKLRELDANIHGLERARAQLVQAMDCACEGRADACKLLSGP